MAITGKLYYPFLVKALSGVVDLTSDNIRVSLHTSSYTPNQTHEFVDDLTDELTAGSTGYSVEGQTVGGATVYDSSGTITFDGNDVSWTSSTISASVAVIYDRLSGTSTTDPLIGYVDFGGTQSSSSGTFTIQWSNVGIATITVS